MTELKTSLRKSHNTTPGPDEIPYEFLKQLPKISLQYLLQIFNNIWHSGNIPNSWKQATIILIPKSANNRKFQVQIGTTLSELQEQEMGVPQGSILSVTLFNIKINNIVKCLNLGVEGSLYVDDFLICCKSKYIRIEWQLQQCLNKINNWTIKNGFKFSKNKTQCIHFCNLHRMHNNPVL